MINCSFWMDGLAWAAINCCGLQCPSGCVAPYYIMGAALMIASVLSLFFPAAVLKSKISSSRLSDR